MKSFPLFAILAATLIAILGFAQPSFHKQPTTQQPTVIADSHIVFILRHAETDPKGGKNPSLTAQGQAHAQTLANMIQDEQLNAIFVTNTIRSMQTAAPTSAATGIATTTYPALDATGLATTIRSRDDHTATLVIAHSNTVPTIITALGGPLFEDLAHDSFDHLYAVILKDGRHVRTVQLRY